VSAVLAVWPWWSGLLLVVWWSSMVESFYAAEEHEVGQTVVFVLTLFATLVWVVGLAVWWGGLA